MKKFLYGITFLLFLVLAPSAHASDYSFTVTSYHQGVATWGNFQNHRPTTFSTCQVLRTSDNAWYWDINSPCNATGGTVASWLGYENGTQVYIKISDGTDNWVSQ